MGNLPAQIRGNDFEREQWIDVARGLSMLCVIIGHMGYNRVNIAIYSFHMPLFFLLAGYFQKASATKIFLVKRAKQLLVPYAFTCIALIVFTQINNLAKIVLHRDDAQAAGYLLAERIKAGMLGSGSRTDFLWIHSGTAIGAIWFLLALFFAQILVNLLMDQQYGILWILGIAVLGTASAHFFWLPLSVQAGAAASVFVAAGYLYRNKSPGGGTLVWLVCRRNVVVVCGCVWFAYLCVSYKTGSLLCLVNASYSLGPLDFIGSTAATIVVLQLCYHGLNRIPLLRTFLAWFGRNSIIVLCFHLIEMAALPFRSVINFGLSALEIHLLILSEGLAITVKVLWCCLAIGIVHRMKMLRCVFMVHT